MNMENLECNLKKFQAPIFARLSPDSGQKQNHPEFLAERGSYVWRGLINAGGRTDRRVM